MHLRFPGYLFVLIVFSACLSYCSEADHTVVEAGSIDDLYEFGDTTHLMQRASEILSKPLLYPMAALNDAVQFPRGTYVSLACYWWPDSSSANRLPYQRRDGEVNPETRSHVSDLPAMIEMAKRVELLSAAYSITGDESFAERAIEQLYSWFIDKSSAMLPHLEHAQMIRGRDVGRSYGVIDTWWLVRVIQSIHKLRSSMSWSDDIETGLKNWFTHYVNWLLNSDFGALEMQSKNNHGTWYDVQLVTFSLFIGQNQFAAEHLETVSKNRLNRQIASAGRQRFETRRPKPEHYSIYNLNGWMELYGHADYLGVDINPSQRFWGGTLEDAVIYLIDMMQGIDFQDILDPLDRTDSDRLYLDLLLKSAERYQNQTIVDEINRIKPQVRNPELAIIKNKKLQLPVAVSDQH